MTIKDLAIAIRERRKQIGLTQEELAKRAFTTQKSISRIETGKENPTFMTLLNIFKALHMNIQITDCETNATRLSTKKD